jgi:hypothetical protein
MCFRAQDHWNCIVRSDRCTKPAHGPFPQAVAMLTRSTGSLDRRRPRVVISGLYDMVRLSLYLRRGGNESDEDEREGGMISTRFPNRFRLTSLTVTGSRCTFILAVTNCRAPLLRAYAIPMGCGAAGCHGFGISAALSVSGVVRGPGHRPMDIVRCRLLTPPWQAWLR